MSKANKNTTVQGAVIVNITLKQLLAIKCLNSYSYMKFNPVNYYSSPQVNTKIQKHNGKTMAFNISNLRMHI